MMVKSFPLHWPPHTKKYLDVAPNSNNIYILGHMGGPPRPGMFIINYYSTLL